MSSLYTFEHKHAAERGRNWWSCSLPNTHHPIPPFTHPTQHPISHLIRVQMSNSTLLSLPVNPLIAACSALTLTFLKGSKERRTAVSSFLAMITFGFCSSNSAVATCTQCVVNKRAWIRLYSY